jgi:hypothetical protein
LHSDPSRRLLQRFVVHKIVFVSPSRHRRNATLNVESIWRFLSITFFTESELSFRPATLVPVDHLVRVRIGLGFSTKSLPKSESEDARSVLPERLIAMAWGRFRRF